MFNFYKTKTKTPSGEDQDYTAAHHPFICELNEKTKGLKKKQLKNGKTGASIIAHCCIRPSHLVGLNIHFNNYCTIIQQY